MDHARNPIDDVTVAYRTADTGNPLVLIHGTALSQAMWRAFGYVQALQASCQLILVDLRGHGRSDKPREPDSYAMDLMLADVIAVLDALGIEHADVMGYSLGARVALSLTVAHPERVDHLVLGGGSSRAQTGTLDRLFFPHCADVLAAHGMPEFLRRWEDRRGSSLDTATVAAFSANDAEALAAYLHRSDVEPGIDDAALQAITTPTRLFIGSEDDIRLPDTRHMAALIPGAELTVVPGFDHMSMIGAKDTVLDIVRPFLTA